MIKTNWFKCDVDKCDLVAWYNAEYDDFFISRNICQKHMDDYKEFLANWRITEIQYE